MAKNKKNQYINLRVSQQQKADLVRFCGGNISRGVREALDFYFSAKSEEAADKVEALDTQFISV